MVPERCFPHQGIRPSFPIPDAIKATEHTGDAGDAITDLHSAFIPATFVKDTFIPANRRQSGMTTFNSSNRLQPAYAKGPASGDVGPLAGFLSQLS